MADLQNDLLEKASDKAHDKVVRIFGHLYTGYSKAAIEEEIIVGENYTDLALNPRVNNQIIIELSPIDYLIEACKKGDRLSQNKLYKYLKTTK